MWSDSAKDRFYEAVKDAVMQGAIPEEMVRELESDYYMAVDDMKKAANYSFRYLLK
jgi:hypothetical protein